MRKLLLGLVLTAMPAMAQQAPDVEHNKAVVREFFTDVLDGGQLQHYTDLHAPNFVAHGNRDYSLAEDKTIAIDERHAAPDLHMQIIQLLGDGDMVAVYWRVRAPTRVTGWVSRRPANRLTLQARHSCASRTEKSSKSGMPGPTSLFCSRLVLYRRNSGTDIRSWSG